MGKVSLHYKGLYLSSPNINIFRTAQPCIRRISKGATEENFSNKVKSLKVYLIELKLKQKDLLLSSAEEC